MTRLFNAYVMVGWSAGSKPATGKDSVWIGVLKPDARFRLQFEAHNPATRDEAMALLTKIVGDLHRLRQRVLIGFNFALGYPDGTAAALKLKSPDWRGLWDFLGNRVSDKPNNINSRFNDAAQMNRLMTDQPWPFWGCPPRDAQRTLTSTKPVYDPVGLPPLQRRTEAGLKTKPLWQLYGAGTVGGEAILGIPRARALLNALGDEVRVWPFQTGWKALKEGDLDGVKALIVEVNPSVIDAKADGGEIVDRAEVRGLAEHFARLDDAGKLGAAFAQNQGGEADRVAVETQEGWILGA